MTIADIKEKLGLERTFGSRFPARIIFTENLDDYAALENQLKGICDITLNAADFCRAPDTVPQFDRIISRLAEYADKQVLLLSAGEYLRLCTKRELDADRRQFRDFWEMQLPEASKTRVIIPVFRCRDIFDRIVGSVGERQQDYVWTLDSVPMGGNCDISVYSPEFRNFIHPDADNLTSWLRDWQTILRRGAPCSIITLQYRNVITLQYRNVETSYGTVNMKPIDSPFHYLTDILTDGKNLDEKWQSGDFWGRAAACASKYAAKKAAFREIALDALNVNDFDFVSIAARWDTLSVFQKDLVWLWYRMYPNDDYYAFACRKAAGAVEIPAKIRDEILLISSRSTRWIEERMAAMKAFAFQSFDEDYFVLMDKLPLAETRLKLLTYQTHEEKAYAVKVISGLLLGGAEPAAIADLLEDAYPSMAAYMRDMTGCDEAVDEYMSWYRKNKLINRYPGEYPVHISFDRFDSRYKVMHKLQNEDCVSFWIDGFGIEYAPLLLHELNTRDITPESVKIAAALLPTETEYNHQWDEHDPRTVKWNRLDVLSHRGMPDDKSYYSCIVHQISVFTDVAKRVDKLLEDHEYVVVTGDHGSSRLAALAFHEDSVVPVTAPAKSTVHSFGRFCELDKHASDMISFPGTTKAMANGKTYFVMNSFQHFTASGNVVGEVHGGNTVEERLVPVIVIKRKQPLPPVACTPVSRFIAKRNGHAETVFSFSRAVSSLEVSLGGNKAACVKNADGTWRVILDDVTGDNDNIILSVIANGRLLPGVTLKVKTQGISKNNDLFGGMDL